MMRMALGVEYDGAAFSGWQTQPGGNTVQDALQEALAVIAGSPVAVVAAGRTDAGVHGSGQVVHFDTDADRPDSAWVRGTNTYLPPALAVRWSRGVPSDFHARFSATGRHYRYFLLNRPIRPAILAGTAGWFHRPLDVEAMSSAAESLLGRHDFTSFRAASCQARTPIRELRRAEIRRVGDLVIFDFAADAFLHHMVRNLVGALVYVGKGSLPPSVLSELLAERDRRRAPPTFAADGLYLVRVDYDERWSIPCPADPPLPFP